MNRATALVFSGIGTQWPGMGRSMLAEDAAFAAAIAEADAALQAAQERSVLALLSDPEGAGLEQPACAHLAIFALQHGLTRSLAARGLQPAAVIGHSAGEVAAALAAGILSLTDAARVIAAHCELIRRLPPGAMLYVAAAPQALGARLAPPLELAALNSRLGTVLSGPDAAIDALQAELAAEGIDCVRLAITVPFHTAALEPQLADFRARLEGLTPRPPQLPMYSAWRGGLAQPGDFTADYWARHIREPVQFARAAQALLASGVGRCLEVSPHPVLLQHLATLANDHDAAPLLEASLQRGEGRLVWPRAAAQASSAEDLHAALQATLEELLHAPCELQALQHQTWGEIGCGSLQLTRLMARLGTRLGRTLPVTLPWRHPTPAALLAALAEPSTEAATAAPGAASAPAARPAADAPIAIVGLACRLPGSADHPHALWQLLAEGQDPITEVPPDRWPVDAYHADDRNAPGRSVSRWGGFLAGQDLREFDARHFRMTPREASALDPQQRLLLEVTWEALEDAGLTPASLKDRRVGVYVGLSTDDYKNATLYRDVAALDPYAGAGAMVCTAAGRLSYFFGWSGPCLAIDTACSSSLVALHVACQALRAGECDLAVIGGANALLTPQMHVYLSKAGILSPTGRCHVFDAAADGYVRAEGCAVLVLQREPDALRDGRRLRARVLGTALNQDGASPGFSTPSGSAQRELLRLAWQQAGITAADLGYLEAHGTGTAIGDPIELEAVTEALGGARSPVDPLLVGSIKSNVGHLEAAAGAASLAKVVLALERGELPANLHWRTPNPHLDWARSPLKVVDRRQPWPLRGGRRIAGISSFGFSGTNAHAVLEAVPDTTKVAPPRPVQLLCLGAPAPEPLQALARRYAQRIASLDAQALADLVCTTHLTRSGLPFRVAVAGSSPAGIAAELERWAAGGQASAQLFAGQGEPGPLVFAFTGQGCQYPGMAAALYRSEPVFRAVLDRCEAALRAQRSAGLLALLLDPAADPATLAASEQAQPAIYAMQCALVDLLAHWGLKPDHVVGHSVGEYAAAYAAGVFSLEDGLALVARRAACMAQAPAGGAMATVAVDQATALAALGPDAGRVSLAAINGPRSVVLSGPAEALDACLARLGPAGARARRLAVSNAFHSPAMDAAAAAFGASPGVPQAPARLSWISTVDGRDFAGSAPDMAYWAGQVRAPVHFHAALAKLEEQGARTFLEIGPAQVLAVLGRDRPGAGERRWIATQDRKQDGERAIAHALAALAAAGHAIDWAAWDAPAGRRRADLPPYPFQRKRHWREPALPPAVAAPAAASPDAPYDWLNRYALARLQQQLPRCRAQGERWQRLLASCQRLLAENPPPQQTDAQWAQQRAAFLARHPSLAGSLELLEDCLAHYPALLAGQQDPLTVLFPQGRLDRVEAVYAHNEVQDRYNARLAEQAARWCAERLATDPRRPLRIVEIGAGTGAATQALLAALSADAPIDYLFTDIGPAFLARARQRFPRLRFATLDIERPPGEQGFAPASADLLVANNVLHATADLPQALAHVRWLAAPGALLLVNEQTGRQAFIHLIFGLMEGWWRFRDALRSGADTPLLPAEHWQAALQQAGFLPAPLDHPTPGGQTILAAHAPANEEGTMPAATPAAAPDARLDTVRALVCELTGLAAEELDVEASLLELGVDSLMLVQLKTLLAQRCGLEVEMADFYGDLDSVAKLAAAAPAMAASQAAPAAAAAAQVQPAALAPIAPALPAAGPGMLAAAAPAWPAAAAPAAASGDLTRLLSQQLEAMSRLLSEHNALLAGQHQIVAGASTSAATQGGTPAAAAPAGAQAWAPAAAKPKASPPNFRSMKLEPDRLTPQQQAFITDLARRYTARTPSSKALADASRGSLADWKNTLSYRHSLKEMMYPIVAARSRGSHFTDLDGNDFLDLTMGCGIALLGHSPDCVVQALHEQVDAGFAIGPQTALAAEVAERFARLTGMERVTFCNTGAEAVMMAVRLARAKTGRDKLVVFSGAYHGTWDGVLGVEHEGETHPIAAGIPAGMVQDLVVLNYGTDEALATLRGIAHEVAAVLVEGVQSRRPGFQPVEFLRQLRAITEQSGAALILDEIITGLRIEPGGCQARFGIRADLATYGKVAGGGLPLSIVAGKAEFMAAVDGGPWRFGDDSKPESEVIYFGGTYVKHPLALAAARAALAHIEQIGPAAYEDLNARAARMAQALNDWFAAEKLPLALAHFGSLFRLEGTGRYSAMMQPIELDLLFLLLNLRGFYIWERRICFLSFAHTDAEVDRFVQAVQDSVQELRANGFTFGLPPLPPAARSGPASSAQRRMFALAGIDGPSVVYNVPLAVHLRGPLDEARLEAAIAQLVQRHPALRTRFEIEGDSLLQRIEPGAAVPLQRIPCPPDRITETLEAFVQPFDLTQAPLARAGLLQVGPGHHVLVMDAHHIVVDGLSLNILARELMAAYAGEALPPPAPDMIDCAWAEVAYLASEPCRRDAAWWRAQFEPLPEPLALPLDRPRPLRRRHRGADLTTVLDAAATARLQAAARARKLPLFPLLLALYAALLQRASAQDDLVIGLPVGGRSDPAHRDTVGMLAATLPLRLRGAAGASLAEAARQAHQQFLAALEHQAYPLDALIGSLALPRDTSRNPLFDTMFIYEDGNDRVYRMPGLDCTPAEVSRHAAMFDLSMEVVQSEGALALRCEYDTDLFEPATAQALLDAYVRLLQLAPDHMDAPLAQLDLADAAQRAAVLAWGNGGPAPAPRTVLELFDAQVRRQPQAEALRAGGQVLSYQALDHWSRQLAAQLCAEGPLAADTPVALLARREASLVAGMLAILRAGAAYLPLEVSQPPERVRAMLATSQCRLALVAPGLELPGAEALRCVPLQTGSGEPLRDAPPVQPDQLANVLFTSGSTGQPKGVMVRHRNLAAMFEGLPAAFGLAAGQKILGVTTPTFDIAGLELLGALCCGLTVVLADREQAEDAAQLASLLAGEQVEVVQLTPTRLRLLLQAAGEAALAGVRILLVGGEPLPQDLADRLASLAGPTVFNVYGPTETTIWSTAWRLAPGPVLLGRPLPGESVYVLSPQRRLQPPGAPGEIAIGGAGVARGYLGDAERTAQRFVEVPGIEGPLYLTGDLGRWRADGQLVGLGRRDDQIKLRGLRLELGEIEYHLRRLPGVRDAAAAVRTNAFGEEEIVAWLVGGPDPAEAAALRSALARWLPPAALPARFVQVTELPRTASGKTDRRALPAPTEPAPSTQRAPQGPLEAAIAGAFSEVLGRPVGPDDDFFLCGGESIRALRLAGRLRGLGLGCELRDLFTWPTPARLAAHLQPLQAPAGAAESAAPGAYSGLSSSELEDLLA